MFTAIFKPLPHESFHSFVSRTLMLSGLPENHFIRNSFGKKNLPISVHLSTNLNFFSSKIPLDFNFLTNEEIVKNHTLLPFIKNFVYSKYFEQLKENCLISINNRYQWFPNIYEAIKACPLCTEENLQVFGFNYWSRLHLIPAWNICSLHHCELLPIDKSSLVPGNKLVNPITTGFSRLSKVKFASWFEIEINQQINSLLAENMLFDLEAWKIDLNNSGHLFRDNVKQKTIISFNKFLDRHTTQKIRSAFDYNYSLREDLGTKITKASPVIYLMLKHFLKEYYVKCLTYTQPTTLTCKVCKATDFETFRKEKLSTTYRCKHCGLWFVHSWKMNDVIVKCIGEKTFAEIKSLQRRKIDLKQIAKLLNLNINTVRKYSRVKIYVDQFKIWEEKRNKMREILSRNLHKRWTTKKLFNIYRFLSHNDPEWLNNLYVERAQIDFNRHKPKVSNQQQSLELLRQKITKLWKTWPRKRITKSLILELARSMKMIRSKQVIKYANSVSENWSDYKALRIRAFMKTLSLEGSKMSNNQIFNKFALHLAKSNPIKENAQLQKLVMELNCQN